MIDIPKEVLIELYIKQKKSTAKIAKIYHCGDNTVYRKLIKYQIPIIKKELLSGRKFTKEPRAKLSEAHKGKKLSERHKRNIGKSSIGNKRSLGCKYNFTPERNKKISLAKKGKPNPGAGWNKGKTSKCIPSLE